MAGMELIEKAKKPIVDEIKQISKAEKISKHNIALEMIAVAVDQSYAGRGIAKELTKLLLHASKIKGFRISFAECSSLYSTNALLKHGAKIELQIPYKDFEYDGKKPFVHVAEPHTSMNLVVFRH